MSKTLLILGAGYAGLPAAHSVLKHHAEKHDLKVVLVSPSEEYYWAIASPRVVVPGQMSDDKVFYNIPKLFQKYPSNRFEFVHGRAETWTPEKNTVTVNLNNGQSRNIDYHTIIVATGSSAKNNLPWKLVGDSAQTHAALADLREKIQRAKTIVIGGAGPTGVELAGELGTVYGKSKTKSVTLVTNDSQLLERRIMDKVRKEAKQDLERLNITIRTDTVVTCTTTDNNGAATLDLLRKNGQGTETIKADLFIPTWGLEFNSDYAPAHLRLPNGRLRVTNTRQIPGHDNAFVVGDVADGEPLQIMFAEWQVKHVLGALETYFAGGRIPDYVPKSSWGHVVSIGPEYGVGQFSGWRLWNWLVVWAKAKALGTNYSTNCAEGQRFVVSGAI